jgi:hypothetical protein
MAHPSSFERFFLRKLGMVHGVSGALEHPTVATEILQKKAKPNRLGRAFGRGGSALYPASPRNKDVPISPKMRFFKREGSTGRLDDRGKKGLLKWIWRKGSRKGREQFSVREVNAALASTDVGDGRSFFPASPTSKPPASSGATEASKEKRGEPKPPPFKDVGHKRFNRLWLQCENPMASASRCIAEGDEALFSMGVLQEGWFQVSA